MFDSTVFNSHIVEKWRNNAYQKVFVIESFTLQLESLLISNVYINDLISSPIHFCYLDVLCLFVFFIGVSLWAWHAKDVWFFCWKNITKCWRKLEATGSGSHRCYSGIALQNWKLSGCNWSFSNWKWGFSKVYQGKDHICVFLPIFYHRPF